MKKLGEILKKYIKKNKKYLHKVDDIEDFVKLENKEFLNINHFINLRSIIQQLLIEMGKRVYFWPFENNAYILDRNHFQQHEKSVKVYEDYKNILNCEGLKVEDLVEERIFVVDSFEGYLKAEKVLEKCKVFGVDLEGKLTEKGFIDLIQVSTML